MPHAFTTVGLIGKPHHQGANNTLLALYHFLQQQGLKVYVEERVAQSLTLADAEVLDREGGEEGDLRAIRTLISRSIG